MNSYWLSWYTRGNTKFELHSPWWCSGYDSDDYPIIVAAVRAESPEAAMERVRLSYDSPPEFVDERFCTENDDEFEPFCGRFPKAKWMEWAGDVTCGCGMETCDGKGA